MMLQIHSLAPISVARRPVPSTAIGLLALCLSFHLLAGESAAAGDTNTGAILQPRIAGDWWQIAGDPDLGDHDHPG